MDPVTVGMGQVAAKIWASLAGMGTPGIIIASILSLGIIYFLFRYNKAKNALAQSKTEQGRTQAQAQNPGQNKKDEDDMSKGEDEIAKIIQKGNN